MTLLDTIHSPADLKRIPRDQLPELAREVRERLIDCCSETGGHIGASLGVVELAIALLYQFDSPTDKILWDVGHQAYAWKLLTGRNGAFPTLRQIGGISGFLKRSESEHDQFGAGHAGTAMSAALGMATARDLRGETHKVVAVVGDGALTCGLSYEGMNNAGHSDRDIILIVNDNGMSISPNVGAISKTLGSIVASPATNRLREHIKHWTMRLGKVFGPEVVEFAKNLEESAKNLFSDGMFFEEMGFRYFGPIDGHDLKKLIDTFHFVKPMTGPRVIHVLTEKGKGHPNAPTHPERVHGVKASAPKRAASESAKLPGPREGERAPQGVAYTKAFSDALIAAAERDLRVHALTAGMPSGTGLDAFAERFPARFHDTGITEQHAVAMAAGMAKAGLRPVAAIYSTFLQRGYDQVFQEVALQGLPVLFCMDRAGLVGQDGPTHNGVFDLAYLRTLPGMVLAAPRDATDLRRMLDLGLRLPGPMALRYPRDNSPAVERIHENERREMQPGKAEVLLEGENAEVVVWALGPLVGEALAAAERLAVDGVRLAVVDARFAKPLDEELLARHAQRFRWIVTLEEHQRAGGFGSAVLEAMTRFAQAPRAAVRLLGVPDRFVEHRTTREEQLAEAGVDAEAV